MSKNKIPLDPLFVKEGCSYLLLFNGRLDSRGGNDSLVVEYGGAKNRLCLKPNAV
jgi:hypothetical protein